MLIHLGEQLPCHQIVLSSLMIMPVFYLTAIVQGNRGGAIYVFDVKACLTDITTTCPLIMGQNFSLEFINNTGLLAGDDIYGGNLKQLNLGTKLC